MKQNEAFVTLFNSRYLSRGLALYESLKNVMTDFMLYIIAFDDMAYYKLNQLCLDNVELISLSEFEDADLLKAKSNRTEQEYCWTCSSKSILYILDKYHLERCTYIDADIFFFSTPLVLLEEMGQNSVMITGHRYSDYCDQAEVSGKYCVQFVTFKNNPQGMQVLQWWVDQCLEWCFARVENSRFGDQKYLDQFPVKFQGVHELKNPGGGVAPWNVDQYTFLKPDKKIYMTRKGYNDNTPLVFFHFHSLCFFDKDVVKLCSSMYRIPDTAIAYIYKEYIKTMEYICGKYALHPKKEIWKNESHFRDNDMDNLDHRKLYYHYSLFV